MHADVEREAVRKAEHGANGFVAVSHGLGVILTALAAFVSRLAGQPL